MVITREVAPIFGSKPGTSVVLDGMEFTRYDLSHLAPGRRKTLELLIHPDDKTHRYNGTLHWGPFKNLKKEYHLFKELTDTLNSKLEKPLPNSRTKMADSFKDCKYEVNQKKLTARINFSEIGYFSKDAEKIHPFPEKPQVAGQLFGANAALVGSTAAAYSYAGSSPVTDALVGACLFYPLIFQLALGSMTGIVMMDLRKNFVPFTLELILPNYINYKRRLKKLKNGLLGEELVKAEKNVKDLNGSLSLGKIRRAESKYKSLKNSLKQYKEFFQDQQGFVLNYPARESKEVLEFFVNLFDGNLEEEKEVQEEPQGMRALDC